MKKEDYPALYRAASAASSSAQTAFLRCIKGYGALTIAGAGLSVYGIESKVSAIWAVILFATGLGLSVLMLIRRYENTWYRTRAVAESIKTASWRFMMCAEPFNHDIATDKKEFLLLLHKILNEHKDLSHELSGKFSEGEQITDVMFHIRQLPLNERIKIYDKQRINEQRSWYAGKSETNKRSGKRWFGIFVGLQCAAIVLMILRVAYPEANFWPTEVFLVAAASVFGWMQIKRFRELAAAYGLAAYEIGIAKTQLDENMTNAEFSSFVGDTENAFSREHTQWIARRDNVA